MFKQTPSFRTTWSRQPALFCFGQRTPSQHIVQNTHRLPNCVWGQLVTATKKLRCTQRFKLDHNERQDLDRAA